MAKDLSVTLSNTQLVAHAHNMRRIYKLADVRRMAVSQAERHKRGLAPCIQPLIVTPGVGVKVYNNREHKKLIVVAGHLRLAGNRYLGEAAPKLNCLIRFYTSESELMAEMSTENGIRADPGPVSWALHFQTQLAEGVPVHTLARQAGITPNRVQALLPLLKLGEVAQNLIDEGKLPVGAAAPLTRIHNQALQAKAARKFVKQHTQISQMPLVIEHLLNPNTRSRYASSSSYQAGHTKPKPEEHVKDMPAAPALVGVPADLSGSLSQLHAAAALTCHDCAIHLEHHQPDAAWHLALAATGQVCDSCNIRLVKDACNGCPLPQMLSRVVRHLQAPPVRP